MEKIENDCQFYLAIFEYIKENGLVDILNFYKNLKEISQSTLLDDYIFSGRDMIKELSEKGNNQKIIEFFRGLGRDFSIKNRDNIKELIMHSSLDKIDLYIENIKKLNKLGITNITIGNPSFHNFIYEKYYDNKHEIVALRKQYSDSTIVNQSPTELKGFFDVDEYNVRFEKPTWILEAENHYEKSNNCFYKYMYMKDFGVSLSSLPSREEAESKNDSLVFVRKR